MNRKKIDQEIGLRLREARLAAGYKTIADFINQHNIPKTTYNQYELGARSLSVESAIHFSGLFKTNLLWLLRGQGSKEYTDEDLLSNLSSQLSEGEFLSMLEKSHKKLSVHSRKIVDRSFNNNDANLISSIFENVLKCYGVGSLKVNLKIITEISLGIYKDTITNARTSKEQLVMIDAALSTLRRTIITKTRSG